MFKPATARPKNLLKRWIRLTLISCIFSVSTYAQMIIAESSSFSGGSLGLASIDGLGKLRYYQEFIPTQDAVLNDVTLFLSPGTTRPTEATVSVFQLKYNIIFGLHGAQGRLYYPQLLGAVTVPVPSVTVDGTPWTVAF